MMVARGAGEGVGGAGEDLSLNMYFFTDSPAQITFLNPLHYTATKSPFTSLEITMGQDKTYGWSAQSYLLVFKRDYRLEIQSGRLVFSTTLVNCCPSAFSLTSPPLPPSKSKCTVLYIQTVCGCGGGGGVEFFCRPNSAGV